MPKPKIDPHDLSRLRVIAYLQSRGEVDYAKEIAAVLTTAPARRVADLLVANEKPRDANLSTFVKELRESVKIGSQWYIERNPDGKYAVTKSGAKRASAIESSQESAIKRAREIDPDGAIHVERVRDTSRGSHDKWRKP